MELFFVDDSGDPGDPNKGSPTDYFVLGGIIINSPEQWIYLRDSLRDTKNKKEYNINPDLEVKWSDILNPNEFTNRSRTRRNPLYHLSMGERIKFAMDVLSIIRNDKSIVIQCVVTKKKSRFFPGKWLIGSYTPNDLFNETYKVLLERYEYHLAPTSAKTKKYGLIIEDQTSGPTQDKRVREFAERIVRSGTEFAEIKHLIETIMFVPSDVSIGIQYADFCVGAVGRKYNSGDDKYFQIIEKNLRGYPKYLGKGLKEYP